ncbi:microtubule-associated tyrosine carboxypeptidase isoform X2 [Latimeria chalumnae]|uniref:microtubule-associated tyrosine carboxypeptidase isoform X2 n=1 Tax=Latimeria chalumnae TaxID=7897 RepID=UPI0003C19F1B
MVLSSEEHSFDRTQKSKNPKAEIVVKAKTKLEQKSCERNGLRNHSCFSSTQLKAVSTSVTSSSRSKCTGVLPSKPNSRKSVGSTPSNSVSPTVNGHCSWMRRSESTCTVNSTGSACPRSRIRNATSLPHIAKYHKDTAIAPKSPCLLVALRPSNVEEEKEKFFKSDYLYNPQFEYVENISSEVITKYSVASDKFLIQAIRIMQTVLKRYGSYENFEVVTGGNILPKSKIWTCIRKYMQKEGCVGEIVVHLTEDLLSQAVMMVENSRPTLTINLSGARQYWLEGMLRHEIGTHYIRGVNNNHQPWNSSTGRTEYELKPANPTEEGLASLHSVLFRKYPFLWRAALLYYTVYQASHMTFSELFKDIAQFVQDPSVRWEYCVRTKRGQRDTSQPGII